MISNGSFHHVSAWHALVGIQHSPHANGFLVVTYGYSMLLLFRLKRLYHLWFFSITPRGLNIAAEVQHPTVFLLSFVKGVWILHLLAQLETTLVFLFHFSDLIGKLKICDLQSCYFHLVSVLVTIIKKIKPRSSRMTENFRIYHFPFLVYLIDWQLLFLLIFTIIQWVRYYVHFISVKIMVPKNINSP